MSLEEFDVDKISKFPLKTDRVLFIEQTFDEFIESGLECCKVTEIPESIIGKCGFNDFTGSARGIAKKRYNGNIKVVERKQEMYLINTNAKEN